MIKKLASLAAILLPVDHMINEGRTVQRLLRSL